MGKPSDVIRVSEDLEGTAMNVSNVRQPAGSTVPYTDTKGLRLERNSVKVVKLTEIPVP